ncbi:hypothetical protein BCR37DRAFT_381143 [Protomyces lactucae-debilis]|uniref:Oxysterol-binding protein n=1 Tax=Protomyces lactucae-debilis TaxID=2754530 RepID=A0A1Y2F993_PROLT|nr:uncharacterized protein BCR37DRAFT_381143 [Protomyces lactucae-debilis]ORY80471.1 hypothetical protein BCR37DRAFT_381143 [Protomyces lactucae-debilis]
MGKHDDSGEVALEDDQKSIIMGIIGQLRPGMDLSRITLPTFVLEPKSMLERITNFMAHPEFLLPIPQIDDPVKRFVEVVRFYMAGWHIRPAGVRKPLNPILGEYFAGYWKFQNNTTALYIAEQVSHHPPISAYFYYSPENHIRVDGVLKPRSKFLGNSAASIMEGEALLTFTNLKETYSLSQPNMYARGILFGKMRMELGDHSTVRCEQTGLVAEIEFKTKGFISGKYDTVSGIIRNEKTGDKLFEIEGKWCEKMTIKDLHTKKTETFFDATGAQETPISAKATDKMNPVESRRLWHETIEAVKARDQVRATNAKSVIEDAQRDKAKARADAGEEWHPQFFDKTGPEDYVFKGSQGKTGEQLKHLMEEMAGGITQETTSTSHASPTTTSSAPVSQPGRVPTPTRTLQYTTQQPASPSAPQPGALPHAATPGGSPAAPGLKPSLHPVDSENQVFVDAQESFDKLTVS